MNSRWFYSVLLATVFLAVAVSQAMAQTSNVVTSATPVYVPDTTHANEPMPDGIFAWDAVGKSVDATADDNEVNFTFYFTNISPEKVAITIVHPSCGCTTAELPELPWILQPKESGKIPITVNISGKSISGITNTLIKPVDITTEKGQQRLMLIINIFPPQIPHQTEEERAKAMALAKVDRQAVFKGDCATCHVKQGEGKFGKELYDADCAICHEVPERATMVPDLHKLKVATNKDFWRTWISHGKPGSFMPAFSTTDGGPLDDMQIASLAQYLDEEIPSKVPSAQ